jgi:hypothetical protein
MTLLVVFENRDCPVDPRLREHDPMVLECSMRLDDRRVSPSPPPVSNTDACEMGPALGATGPLCLAAAFVMGPALGTTGPLDVVVDVGPLGGSLVSPVAGPSPAAEAAALACVPQPASMPSTYTSARHTANPASRP